MIAKVTRAVGWGIGILLGLILILFLTLMAITDEQYKEWITSAVESSTGRDFVMEDFSLDLGSSLSASARGVQLGNAEWSDQGNMLSVGNFEFDISLWRLLAGVADVRLVTADAEVLVETSDSGESNWAMGTPGDEAEEEPPAVEAESDETGGIPIQPLLREIRLENIVVTMSQPDADPRTAELNQLLIETIEEPDANTTISLSAAVEQVPIELSGDLGDVDAVLSGAESPLNISGSIDENTLGISGNWGPVYPEMNLDLSVDLDVPSTSKLMALANLSDVEMGQLNLEFDLSALDNQFSITRINTTLDGELAVASIKGSLDDVIKMQGFDLDVTANVSFLNQLLNQLGVEVPAVLPPDVGVSAHISGQLDPLEIQDIRTEVRDEGLEILVSGSVGNALALSGVDGQFVLRADSTSTFSKYAGLDLPDLGVVEISGDVLSAEDLLRLESVDARISSPNVNFSVTGAVDDIIGMVGIDLVASGDIDSFTEKNIAELKTLFEQLQVNVPLEFLPERVNIGANASGSLEQLAVSDIQGNISDSGVEINLAGAIDNAIAVEGVSATVNLTSEGTAVFSRYAGTEVPELGPVDVQARVSSTEDSYELQDLVATVGTEELNVAMKATIADLIALKGLNATIDTSISSLSNLSDITKTALPETQPIVMRADVSTLGDGETDQAKLDLNVETGNTTVKLNGSMPNLTSLDDLNIMLAMETDSLQDFNQFAQKELPDKGPFSLSGELGVAPGTYSLEDFQLDIADQSARGNVRVKMPETADGLTSLEGELVIPYLDLSPFLIPAPQEKSTDTQEQSASTAANTGVGKNAGESAAGDDINVVATDRLFSTEPLPLDQLRLINADFSVNAERLTVGKLDLRDFQIALLMKDGVLDINPIQGQAGNGEINGLINLDGSKDVVDLDLNIVVDSLPMPNLGGEMDLNIDLDGDGASVADIMGTLNGQLLLVMRDGEIAHSFVTNFGSGLFSFSGNKDTTELECAILRMDIQDGLADFDDKLAVQMTDVNWRGGGQINFKTEKLGVGITPKPRGGLGISIAGLADLVYIGGTLKEPKVLPNPADIAVQYGKYMAYLSTGGLSLVAEALFNKSQADVDMCEQILDGTVFDVSADDIIKAQEEAEMKAQEEAEAAGSEE